MRSRDLRITSFIVVFPVALILLSLCTILCLAIASQIKSLYPSLFSTPREPAAGVYGSLAAVNPGLNANFSGSTSRRSFGASLTLRSLLSGVFLLCAALSLFVLACRFFHKLRTRHALDSCLEKLAEYRIPGTMYMNPKKIPRLSRWSPFSTSLFLSPPPASPSPPLGTASWLLSRSGNGSLSLHSPEDPHGTTSFVSALSSTLASSKPYYRFDSSSSNHSSSSHLYIPEQQLHDHLLAPEEAPLVSQELDQPSSNISPVAQSLSTQDTPPIASAFESMDVEEKKPQQTQQPESAQQHSIATKEPQPPNKKPKAKKKPQQMKPTKQQQQQHVVQKDLIVIPAPATEPPSLPQQKRTTNGGSGTKKKREQKRQRQSGSKDPIQQRSQRLPTPEPSPLERPQHCKEPKEPEKHLDRQHHPKPATQPQQNWYSPFSTGLEIDIMPRSPSIRRYTLFGDAVPPAPKDDFISHDSNHHGQFALPSYGAWPLPQRTGLASPLSASPPSPPLGIPHPHRQFRPLWPGSPSQDTSPRLNRAAGSNKSLTSHPPDRTPPFSLFSNDDDHLCFH